MPSRKGLFKKTRGWPIAREFGKIEIAAKRLNLGLGWRKVSNQVVKHYF